MIEGDDENIKLEIACRVYDKVGGRMKMPAIANQCQALFDFVKNAKPTKKKRRAPEGEKVVNLHPRGGRNGAA